MMDQLSAQLMANLDISKLNQQLTAYIDKEIQKSLEEIQEKVNQNFVEKIARLDIDLSYLNGK
jgi:BMFP domain-containing protein YqiC